MRAGVVLVHGANHGPWCWRRVVPLLEARGLAVATPDLYAGPHPSDPGVVQQAVDRLREHGPVVVCGHSFGGYAITSLDPSTVAHLVYLAAILPDREVWYEGLPVVPNFFELVTVDEAGMMWPKPECLATLWYDDCRDVIPWAQEQLRPHPVGDAPAVIERPAWREVPTTYVVCEADGSLTQEYLRAAAARVGTWVSWPTSHSPMLSRPELVAELLGSIATDLAA